MSFKRSTGEVVERQFWTIVVRDEFRPDGEEWYKRFDSREAATEELERLVRKELLARVGEEIEIPEWP